MSAPERVMEQLLAAEKIVQLAAKVALAYTAEAEDWNDGEYALWHKDDLVHALTDLRSAFVFKDLVT